MGAWARATCGITSSIGFESSYISYAATCDLQLLFDETMMTRDSPRQALCRVFAWSTGAHNNKDYL